MSVDEFIQDNTKYNGFVPYHADGLKYKPRKLFGLYQQYHLLLHQGKTTPTHNTSTMKVPLSSLNFFFSSHHLKFYIWNRTNWKMKEFPCIIKIILSKRMKNSTCHLCVKQLFSSFSNTEIWHPQMLDNNLSQYQYLKSIGVIHLPEDIEAIGRNLLDWLII